MQEGLLPHLKDNQNAWELDSHGHYQRKKVRPRQLPFSAQEYLMKTLGG
jgi:polyphosphate kinase